MNHAVVLFCCCLLLASPKSLLAELLYGRVIGVSDGDTLTVLDSSNVQYKVRLSGIDAPEKRQPFGNVSKKSLSDLAFDGQANVYWHKKDRYQRLIGKVYVSGIDVNLEQIKRGMAWYYLKYKKELSDQDQYSYEISESFARDNQIGLWADENPIPPWDFRSKKKE